MTQHEQLGTGVQMRRTAQSSLSQQEQQQLEQEQQQQFQPSLVTWEQIRQPGAYVDTQTGELYRIPKQALVGGEPIISREGNGGQIQLLQVSLNPFITTQQAGRIAARNQVPVSFQ